MQIDPVVASTKPAASAVRPPATELPRANRVIPIPDFTLDGDLTAEQSDFFETFGFIRFKRFVPRERAQALYQSVLEIDAKLVADGREKVNGVPLIFGKRTVMISAGLVALMSLPMAAYTSWCSRR